MRNYDSYRIVLGLGFSKLSIKLANELRKMGWDVQTTNDGEGARRIAVRETADALVMPYNPHDQLSVAKVVQSTPEVASVVLITPKSDQQAVRFARFMGVALASENDELSEIMTAVESAITVKA